MKTGNLVITITGSGDYFNKEDLAVLVLDALHEYNTEFVNIVSGDLPKESYPHNAIVVILDN